MAKEEKSTEEEVKSLRGELDSITFKNEQARKIRAVQAGKEKLKDSLAKNRQRRVSSASRITGMGGLGTLETFQSKYKNYNK